ncbi:MAG TPA: CsgG/HfaB family protein [Thermoanaerobaculia bacterium]|nr:CsgG/HfaB family protein [Thermoanaerobaculia bacterium]
MAGQVEKPVYKMGLVLSKGKWKSDLDQDVLNAATRAFVDARRFNMVERSQLDAVFTEKDLQGFLGKGNKELSDVLGLDFIGLVAYNTETKKLAGASSAKVFMIEVRLVDVKTGSILMTLTSERSDLLVAPTSPNEAGNQLFENVREAFPPLGYIIKVSGKEIVVDLGSGAGVKKGDTLEVVREGEEIIHPRTGEILPAELVVVGKLKVVSASSDRSLCKLSSGEVDLGSPVRFKGKSSWLEQIKRKGGNIIRDRIPGF